MNPIEISVVVQKPTDQKFAYGIELPNLPDWLLASGIA